MAWSEQQVRGAVRALKYVMGVADLTDAECDALADLVLPKFIECSGLGAVTFQTIVRAMHRAEEERSSTRH
jgi:hypothetical protein